MADKNVEHTHPQVETDPLLKAKSLWDQYSKPVLIVLAVLIVVFGGWYGYKTYVAAPNEEKAALAIYTAEEYFREDSSKLALNGDGFHKGFLYVINNYGSTKTGNLAKYYAGISYLKTGDFNNAVKYLSDFSTSAKQIQMMAYGALGDAYSELGKKEDAVSSYKKASETFTEDELNSSEYLFRAALKSKVDGNNQQALELFKKLKEQFPNTAHGREADKYIHSLSDETGLTSN